MIRIFAVISVFSLSVSLARAAVTCDAKPCTNKILDLTTKAKSMSFHGDAFDSVCGVVEDALQCLETQGCVNHKQELGIQGGIEYLCQPSSRQVLMKHGQCVGSMSVLADLFTCLKEMKAPAGGAVFDCSNAKKSIECYKRGYRQCGEDVVNVMVTYLKKTLAALAEDYNCNLDDSSSLSGKNYPLIFSMGGNHL